jgi:hypothetical protein
MKSLKGNNLRSKMVLVLTVILACGTIALCYPPDNAAVLYYKACLVIGDPPDEIADVMNDAIKGKIEANEQLKEFAESQSSAIELTMTAAAIEGCDWGMDYSKGFELLLPHLGPMRRACKVILLDAQIKAGEGDIEKAMEQSLTCFRIARHIKNDTTIISSLVGMSVEQLACETIGSILSKQAVSEELLNEIRDTLNEMTENYGTMKECLRMESEIAANYMRTKSIPELLEVLGIKEDEKTAELDEEMLAKSITYYRKHMEIILKAFEQPYAKAIDLMQATQKKLEEDIEKNNTAVLASIIAPAMEKCLNNEVLALNRINALRCAVEIYLQIQKADKLPDKLPSGSPKDTFSNKNFVYEKKEDGFILRCQGKDLVKDEIHAYEFGVAK